MQLWRHGKIETKKMFKSRAIRRQQSILARVSSLEKLAGSRDCRCIGCVREIELPIVYKPSNRVLSKFSYMNSKHGPWSILIAYGRI